MKSSCVIVFFIFLLASCSLYESEHPISAIDSAVNSDEFIGEWMIVHKKDSAKFIIRSVLNISSIGANRYHLNSAYFDPETQKTVRIDNFTFYQTLIDSVGYFNLKDIRDGKNDHYLFARRQYLNPLQFRLLYLTDRLDRKFESSNEFQNFIENSPNDFHAAFDTLQIPYYRPSFFTWNTVYNQNVEDIKVFGVLKQSFKMREFKENSFDDLRKLDHLKIPLNAVVDNLNSYHITSDPKPTAEPYLKFGYLEYNNGEKSKLIFLGSEYIYDLSNDYLFKMNKDKEFTEEWPAFFE